MSVCLSSLSMCVVAAAWDRIIIWFAILNILVSVNNMGIFNLLYLILIIILTYLRIV